MCWNKGQSDDIVMGTTSSRCNAWTSSLEVGTAAGLMGTSAPSCHELYCASEQSEGPE